MSPDSEHTPVAPASRLDDLLSSYTVPPGHFDELLEAPGRLRPQWRAFSDRTGDIGPDDLTRAQARVARQLHDDGVTYNIHAAGSPERPWTLDVLPHIVPASEWVRIDAAVRQRARLLEAIVRDIYSEQRLLTSGLLPPALVFGHSGFLRACHGVRPASGVWLHLVAFDLGRGADGQWRVWSSRTQAPSGAGYALENRLMVSRLYPDAFRDQHVQLMAPFFRTLQDAFLESAPRTNGTPHVVLLTPGRYNETYFEHAYLSRYLGFTLVEGADLTVRDDAVYLKTVTGLRRVHAILRRLDDDFCDPLELRADSALGVPGLVRAWRAGSVLMANAFGSGVLESTALESFMPVMCAELLGEQLQMQRLEATAEDHLRLSHAPVWAGGRLESRSLLMRVFLVADGRGDYRVLPGGLSRIAGTERHVVSGQEQGGSKDTWVLSESPIERFSLLPGRLRAPDIARSERAVSSRAAEHLFWLGRYAERSENVARLLRAVLSRLPQGDASVSAASTPLVAVCRRHELLPAPRDRKAWPAHEFERALIDGLLDPVGASSLAFYIARTVRVAGAVRERLSSDNWRVLNQVLEVGGRDSSRETSVSEALELVDHVILLLVAIGGLEMAHMTRDDGWRFMSLGRHLERVLFIITTTREVARSGMVEDPALLEWLLDLSDSIITYRARYMGRAEWLAVADLLLFDRRNPRSATFQLSKLAKHLPLLPGGGLNDEVGPRIERMSRASLEEPDTRELFQRPDAIEEFLSVSEDVVLHLSDALTLRYFSHVAEPARSLL